MNAIPYFASLLRVTVSFYWMFGHSDIQGNKFANELIRNGSTIPFSIPELAMGISSYLIRNTALDIFKKKQYLIWLSYKVQQ